MDFIEREKAEPLKPNYNLFLSNSPHKFVEHFSDYFHSQDLLGGNQIIVVQNDNVAHWLRLALTDYLGITMQLTFKLPEQAIRHLLTFFPLKKSILYPDEMQMALDQLLRKLPPEHPISTFVQASSSPSSKDLRYYQIAKQLSTIFHNYHQNAYDIPMAWEKGRHLFRDHPKPDYKKIEAWQKDLWSLLFGVTGQFVRLSPEILDIDNIAPPSKLPKISIFGTAFLSATQINLFHCFSRYTAVNQFMWSPFNLDKLDKADSVNSILLDWGKVLLDNYTFLKHKKAKNNKRINLKAGYTCYSHNDILSLVKNHILNLSKPPLPPQSVDLSTLKVIGAPGQRREIEILKQEITALMEQDSSLLLNQIGVMAIEIENYRSFISSIFSDNDEHPGLTYNIVDINFDTNAPLINGFRSILELAESDFHIDKIEKFLNNPIIKERLNLSQHLLNEVIACLKDHNIIWGLNTHHRQSLHKGEGDHNTWMQGIDRFILGRYYKADDDQSSLFAQFTPEEEVVRNMLKSIYIQDPEFEKILIKVLTYIHDLYLDIYFIPSLSLSMPGWVDFSRCLINTYLKPPDNVGIANHPIDTIMEEKKLFNSFSQLVELVSKIDNPSLSYQSFKMYWGEQIEKKASNRGGYLTQGVTFSSLKPMRSIPFKHIFLLGINEKDFPREFIPSQLDLSPLLFRPKLNTNEVNGLEHSPIQIDQFSFLETIFCAQKSLHIFYHNQDLLNHNPLHPANLVSDLVQLISEYLSIDLDTLWSQIYTPHPLHNFDTNYFSNQHLNNFSTNAYKAAMVHNTTSLSPQSAIKSRVQTNIPISDQTIYYMELLDLFKTPANIFMKRGIGAFMAKKTKQLNQKEPTEIPFFKFLDYLKSYPYSALSFDHYLTYLQDRDYVIKNHFNAFNRKQYKQHWQALITKFEEIGLVGKEKKLELIKKTLIDQKQYIQSPSFLYCPPFKLETSQVLEPFKDRVPGNAISLSGQLDYYQGNYILMPSIEKQDTFSLLSPYLKALLISYGQSASYSQRFKLISFNLNWRDPVKYKEIELNPDKVKEILPRWIKLFLSHLSNPTPFYLEPAWSLLKKSLGKKDSSNSFDFRELDPKELKKLIRDYLDQKDNQETYRYSYFLESGGFEEYPWEDLGIIMNEIMD